MVRRVRGSASHLGTKGRVDPEVFVDPVDRVDGSGPGVLGRLRLGSPYGGAEGRAAREPGRDGVEEGGELLGGGGRIHRRQRRAMVGVGERDGMRGVEVVNGYIYV